MRLTELFQHPISQLERKVKSLRDEKENEFKKEK